MKYKNVLIGWKDNLKQEKRVNKDSGYWKHVCVC